MGLHSNDLRKRDLSQQNTFLSTGLAPGKGTASALAAALGKLLVIQSSRSIAGSAAAADAEGNEAA